MHSLNDIKPPWAASAPLGASVELGEGFTPSGSLLRASLAMAASPLPEEVRNGGEESHELHNPYDGWGALNLSRLFDPMSVDGLGESPTNDTWIHDSYRLTSGSVGEWFEVNKGESGDLSGMVDTGAPLDGAIGPFLQTGDVFSQRLALIDGEDVRIRMAFPAQPEPAMVDDLQLRVRLEDGTILLPDHQQEGDGSQHNSTRTLLTPTTPRPSRHPMKRLSASIFRTVIFQTHHIWTLMSLLGSCSRVAKKGRRGWMEMRLVLLSW